MLYLVFREAFVVFDDVVSMGRRLEDDRPYNAQGMEILFMIIRLFL